MFKESTVKGTHYYTSMRYFFPDFSSFLYQQKIKLAKKFPFWWFGAVIGCLLSESTQKEVTLCLSQRGNRLLSDRVIAKKSYWITLWLSHRGVKLLNYTVTELSQEQGTIRLSLKCKNFNLKFLNTIQVYGWMYYVEISVKCNSLRVDSAYLTKRYMSEATQDTYIL